MKKVFKILGIILALLLVVLVILYFIFNKPLPQGKKGPEAEALAQKMMKAVNKDAWDSTHVLSWTFRGTNDYLWDKKRNFVQVKWGDNKVLLNTKQVIGKAYKGDQEVTGDTANKLVQKAWGFFCNDSWWFNAAVKANDVGTERSIVKLDDGSDGLLVTYSSGGTTPGDSYLWKLDENGLPKSYQMWVSIIPVGGVEFTWEDWMTLDEGAKISTMHRGLLDIPITNVKGARDFSLWKEDPFGSL